MKNLLLFALVLAPLACTGKSESATPSASEAGTAAASQAEPLKSGPIEGDFTVECGCTIDGINECGNYMHLGGHAYLIEGDLGIDKHMEWCGKGKHLATIQGTLEGKKCLATSLTVKP